MTRKPERIVVQLSWWLDWSGLPERLLWARLKEFSDGSAEVLDLDGRNHQFPTAEAARCWLFEDEYSRVEDLIEGGEVAADISPPIGSTDQDLIPQMSIIQIRR